MGNILDTVKLRRSIRVVGPAIAPGDEELKELLGQLVLHMPTAMNMQSSRLVLLLGDAHKTLWDIVHSSLAQHNTNGVSEATQKKLAGFTAGHGSILFFDDSAVTQSYADKLPTYKDNFIPWALQQNGMLQFAVWAALAEQGIGASLQHYNPLIDEAVRSTWGLPESWVLYAQMPFGHPEEAPGQKEFLPLEDRMRIFE